MNVISKVTEQEISDMFGFMAFLADKDACVKRLRELQTIVADAETAQVAAAEATKTAVDDSQAAAEKTHNANVLYQAAVDMNERLETTKTELDTRDAAIAVAEKKNSEHEEVLRKADIALVSAQEAVAYRAAMLDKAEAEFAVKVAEHEKTVEKLRAFVG